jgi:probable F420-dependent oxidoreductase
MLAAVKFGIMAANVLFTDGEGAKAVATAADDLGYESIWTVEHVVVPADYQSWDPYSKSGKMGGPDDMSIPDSFTWLAYIAAVTKQIKLATGVAILPQRNVVYTAKEMATLDQLSGGRVILGAGAGWMKEEFDVLGVPFERRGERMDEYIKALRVLWGDEKPTFEGGFVSFTDTYCRPQPVNKRIPIHIGGRSDRAARRAGELGDGFFPGRNDDEVLAHAIDVMRRAAEKHGRDPDAIEVTAVGAMDPAGVEKLRALGVSRIVIPPLAMDTDGIRGALETFANDVIAKVS